MNSEVSGRFERSFAPRIAAHLAGLFGPTVKVDVVPRAGHGYPTRVRIVAATGASRRLYDYPLNISLTWDGDEIERLLESDGEARFARYLGALERKLQAWETARDVDFASRTQRLPEVLIGGLDFEA